MDTLTFLGLQATEDPWCWRLPVVPSISSGMGALFGGCGLAAGVEAMERATGRPLVWATAQFFDYARPPSIIDIAVTEVVRGHQVSQALASLRVDDQEIVTVSAALGRRTLDVSGSWARRPEVPPPQDCPERPLSRRYRGTIADRIHARLARGRPPSDFPGPPGDGRSALWLQVADLEQGAGLMAIIGDYVPFGISQATGRPAGGNSLDNTLRVVDAGTASGWILADVEVYAVARGFAHGRVHLWSEDGRLLATATQSAMVRLWDEEGRPVRSA